MKEFEADFIVFNKIILELKAIQSNFLQPNYIQIISELKLWNLRLGLLVNFGLQRVKTERIPFTDKKKVVTENHDYIKDIITEFGPRYASGAEVLYIGDTGEKMGLFDKEAFEHLGLTFDSHGKFPDIVMYLKEKNWLLLIESVTSHGPVDAKRHSELANLSANSIAGIVYVTAFSDRQTMARYIEDISWETEVWVANAPTHLIHFNGERFLGPYDGNG